MEAAKQKAGEAMDMASGTAQATKDRAVEGQNQTGSFLGEKTDAAKKIASETTEAGNQKACEAAEAAKQKASETTQYVQDKTSDTKDSAVAGKDTTGNVFQQAGGQVMSTAVGAKDMVMNTLGMGGDKGDDAGSTTN